MLTLTNVFQRFFGATKAQSANAPAQKTQAMIDAEETREFLLSIAHLPAEQREQRIQHREALKQMVARQGIMEAEAQANNYWKS